MNQTNSNGRGGSRKGAGRKPGAVTKKTREIANKAHESGITPLEVMLEAMRKSYEAGDLKEAANFAKDAAPYVHAKLSNVTADVEIKTPELRLFLNGTKPSS